MQNGSSSLLSVKNITMTNVKGSCGCFGSVAGGQGYTFNKFRLENIDVTLSRASRLGLGNIAGSVVKDVKINDGAYTGP